MIVGNDATESLRSLPPLPISETDRTEALESVPAESVLVPDTEERAKLEALQTVLVYHDRQQVIETKLIDVPRAVVGLYQRSVVLISRPALRVLSETDCSPWPTMRHGLWRGMPPPVPGRHAVTSVLELRPMVWRC